MGPRSLLPQPHAVLRALPPAGSRVQGARHTLTHKARGVGGHDAKGVQEEVKHYVV